MLHVHECDLCYRYISDVHDIDLPDHYTVVRLIRMPVFVGGSTGTGSLLCTILQCPVHSLWHSVRRLDGIPQEDLTLRRHAASNGGA